MKKTLFAILLTVAAIAVLPFCLAANSSSRYFYAYPDGSVTVPLGEGALADSRYFSELSADSSHTVFSVDKATPKGAYGVGEGCFICVMDEKIPGDADANGQITTSDARYVLRAAVGINPPTAFGQQNMELAGGANTSSARNILLSAVNNSPVQSATAYFAPHKSEYKLNESLDADGAFVFVTYQNGKKELLPVNPADVKDFNSEKAGNGSFSIKFGNFTVSYLFSVDDTAQTFTANIVPFTYGFITRPVHYYTAYYDVDFEIEKMYAEFNGDGNWIDLSSYDNSFTNNACMVELTAALRGTTPSVKLRAVYSKKTEKIAGTPVFELVGYKIKATIGDYSEYFSPWAEPPVALVSEEEPQPIQNYLTFERKNTAGATEKFYLPLRPASTSRFTVNGLSPTNFDKVFKASQNIKSRYYRRLFSYYAEQNGQTQIKFVDMTDKSIPNYDEWKAILRDSIETFNSCLGENGINAHIEEVGEGESNNMIFYGAVPNNYAGLCQLLDNKSRFSIYVNGDKSIQSSVNEIKSTTVHEMGHLLGFEDSAYSINDSLYAYSRNREAVTYFQPNDLATLKAWMKNG